MNDLKEAEAFELLGINVAVVDGVLIVTFTDGRVEQWLPIDGPRVHFAAFEQWNYHGQVYVLAPLEMAS